MKIRVNKKLFEFNPLISALRFEKNVYVDIKYALLF